MRREELYSYLADPDRLTPETLPAVTQLYEAYPYCGVFALLYLYNLCIAEDVRYPSELRRLAPILPDRERLFRLVRAVALRRRPLRRRKLSPTLLPSSIPTSRGHAPRVKHSQRAST